MPTAMTPTAIEVTVPSHHPREQVAPVLIGAERMGAEGPCSRPLIDIASGSCRRPDEAQRRRRQQERVTATPEVKLTCRSGRRRIGPRRETLQYS